MKSSRTPWVEKLRPELEPKLVAARHGAGRRLVPRGKWQVEGFAERAAR